MNKKYIALTFDDGPSADATVQLLNLLNEYSVTASFFVCGQSITDETAPVMCRAHEMGCEINNHSFTHPAFTGLTEEQMLHEVEATSALVESVIGSRPRFFRPPYISVDERVLKTVDMPFICGVGTEDWDESCSAQRRYDDIMAQARDGAIILMHDSAGNSKTVEAVSRIIPALLDDGYIFVTVSELFSVKGTDPDDHRYVYSVVPQGDVMYREQWFVSEDKGKNSLISVCGDNCAICPRYNADSEERLGELAELWFRLGWRESIAAPEEMSCTGCGSRGQCAYGLMECCERHSVERCTLCGEFPCGRIHALLDKSEQNRQKCLEVCSREEYRMLERAFFKKAENLGLVPDDSGAED